VSSSVAMESSGGHICQPVVDASDGVGDKWGCFVDVYAHGQGSREASSDGGSGCTEFVCPAHGRGVVAPSSYVDVSEGCEVF
jgi:hypothetical protein